MKVSSLKVELKNQYKDYENQSLLLSAIRSISPVPVEISTDGMPHILINGPFQSSTSLLQRAISRIKTTPKKTEPSVTIFHSEENTRFNEQLADYSITSDLGVTSCNHFRAPNWWSSIDWREYGVSNVPSPRIRSLIKIETLLKPLGNQIFNRKKRVALFTSHMREPRLTLFQEIEKILPVDGFGRHFNQKVKDHNLSGCFKEDILKDYLFSLCPENSMYPGYYTEKVPESFAAGCIPITWADQNIDSDFQPGSFINLADYAGGGYCNAFSDLINNKNLEKISETPLLIKHPDFEKFLDFIKNIINEALAKHSDAPYST